MPKVYFLLVSLFLGFIIKEYSLIVKRFKELSLINLKKYSPYRGRKEITLMLKEDKDYSLIVKGKIS